MVCSQGQEDLEPVGNLATQAISLTFVKVPEGNATVVPFPQESKLAGTAREKVEVGFTLKQQVNRCLLFTQRQLYSVGSLRSMASRSHARPVLEERWKGPWVPFVHWREKDKEKWLGAACDLSHT